MADGMTIPRAGGGGGETVDVELLPGDVEIGAVEIKDGTSDTRAKVAAGNTAATADLALAVADANVLAKLTTLDTRVDGVETLLTAIDGHVDGVEALLTTIDGRVDGVEGLLTPAAGTPTQPADITVDATAGGVVLLAANASRTAAVIQNTAAPGGANMRVRLDGDPTATRGIQLGPGATLRLSMPNCPRTAVKAIREGAVNTAAAVLEVV